MNSYISLEHRNGILLVWMDQQNEKVNKVSPDLLNAFVPVLDQVEQDPSIRAAIFISKKKDFIAGADIEGFQTMGPGDAAEVSKRGHILLDRIEQSSKPFIAAIQGAAMGAGLEIALACTSRIASDHPSTVLALPEVKLGLLPGGGGTQRLPRLLGIQKALDMMLTGKNIYAHKAFTIGLVDKLVPHENLETEALALAERLSQGSLSRKNPRNITERILESNSLTRGIIYRGAKKMVLQQTKGNYPAPLKIIECVREGMENGLEAGKKKEVVEFDALVQSPESRQLVHLFFAVTGKKKNPLAGKVRSVKEIGIVGAGLMGQGIAEVSLLKGLKVSIKDLTQAGLDKARLAIQKVLDKRVSRKAISQREAEIISDQLSTRLDDQAFERSDMVIEAVFEDINLKKKVLAEVEANSREGCIFASNTSALPIAKIAENAQRPGQVVGMHYFSPVQKMPLLEIIKTDQTEEWVIASALEVGIQQGKTCIVVKDGPGFYTTRIIAPFLNEALLMIEEGADILNMDRVMKEYGFPVGPATLIDEVGIDVGAHVTSGELSAFFQERGGKASLALKKMADAGLYGRKNFKGFYQYDPQTGKRLKGKLSDNIYSYFDRKGFKRKSKEEIQQRLVLMMVFEALYCLQDATIASAEDGDLGAVLGLGFPPFLGGPFRYIDSQGADKIVAMGQDLEKKHGSRFSPPPLLLEYAQSGKRFYGPSHS